MSSRLFQADSALPDEAQGPRLTPVRRAMARMEGIWSYAWQSRSRSFFARGSDQGNGATSNQGRTVDASFFGSGVLVVFCNDGAAAATAGRTTPAASRSRLTGSGGLLTSCRHAST